MAGNGSSFLWEFVRAGGVEFASAGAVIAPPRIGPKTDLSRLPSTPHVRARNRIMGAYAPCARRKYYAILYGIMRKGDQEILETRLEPLQAARDRHEAAINSNKRATDELLLRVSELERDKESYKTAMEQANASVRSLLQRANRAARETGIIEDDDGPEDGAPLAEPVQPVNYREARDGKHRAARTAFSGGRLL